MSSNGVDKNAIYYEIKPRTIWLVRIVNIITVLMILIAVISCFVQGHKNRSYYLLVANLILSGLVYLVVNWWYKTGDLDSNAIHEVQLLALTSSNATHAVPVQMLALTYSNAIHEVQLLALTGPIFPHPSIINLIRGFSPKYYFLVL
ncbi:unnamed protein product [Lymnaea stagnalis]|uniref:Uncharacterized protein n=1 Tax=Lymnaea stagnalis TaxID=6523 RepID=A0AAV2HJM8_LYMST